MLNKVTGVSPSEGEEDRSVALTGRVLTHHAQRTGWIPNIIKTCYVGSHLYPSGRWRQKSHKFKVTLHYKLSLRLARFLVFFFWGGVSYLFFFLILLYFLKQNKKN